MAPKKSAKKKAAVEGKEFAVGDIVTVKVKGYPDWPGRVHRQRFVRPLTAADRRSGDGACPRGAQEGLEQEPAAHG